MDYFPRFVIGDFLIELKATTPALTQENGNERIDSVYAYIREIRAREEKQKAIGACDAAYTISVTGRECYQALFEKLDRNAVMLGIYGMDGKIAGYAAFYANDTDSRRAYMSLFCIRKPMQRKYLGSALMRTCMQEAKSRGMESMRLEVLNRDSGAIEFYRRMGFTETGRRDAFIQMEKELTA